MNPYNGNENNFPATLLMPDDLDPAAAAYWLAALEGLADRTRALRPVVDSYFPNVGEIAFGSWTIRNWTKPTGSLFQRFILKGGGGGGAGGLAVVGAGGGGAGELVDIWVPSALVPNALTVTMGAMGAFGYYIEGTTPQPEGGTGGVSSVVGTDFEIAADGGWGALQKPSRYTGAWPPSPIHEGVGGVGRGIDQLMLTPFELMSPASSVMRVRGAVRGANGGAGEFISNNAARAGGPGETAPGGLAGGSGGPANDDGGGGWGAGAGGGGSRSRTSAAKGGGGAGGYQWRGSDGALVQAQDGVFIPGTDDVWRGGKGAPGLVVIISFRGALT